MRSLALLVCLSSAAALAAFFVSFRAKADPPPLRSLAVKELFADADRAVDQLDIARARELWAQVYQLEPSTAAICQIGQLDRRLDRVEEAAAELCQCIHELRAPRDERERLLWDQRHADFVAVKQRLGALTVNVSDPKSEVIVDGRRAGLAPLKCPVFVAPGEHRVVAQLGGMRVAEIVHATGRAASRPCGSCCPPRLCRRPPAAPLALAQRRGWRSPPHHLPSPASGLAG